MPPATADVPAAELPEAETFINRELSWLDFNSRVLELAEDEVPPLLERVKFLAIFASNLDEFFMKRVGGLQRQRAAGVTKLSLDGLSPREQLDRVHARIRPLLERATACWFEQLHPALKKAGIAIRRYGDLTPEQKEAADAYFAKHVFPVLTPLAVDTGHPFPFISNLSKSLGVALRDDKGGGHFVRVKLPENLPRWVPVPTPEGKGEGASPEDRRSYVPLEGVIGGNLDELFPGMTVEEHHLFRVTRNADVEMDEEDADDLLSMVEQELRRRRMAGVVRLELPERMSATMRQLIARGMKVEEEDIYTVPGPIDIDDLMQLTDIDRPDLKYDRWRPLPPAALADPDADIFDVIRRNDVLVHHPYEDFGQSVERFVMAAADDPRVLALKMTLYRTSRDNKFVPALIRAAEAGKQVAVLVELKARFDEQRNVELAQKLEKAGVHVVYGFVGLKTHTKTALVVRDEEDGPRAYCHIGTGNYNSRTATLYTDLGLFTTDAAITGDIVNLFHYLTGHSRRDDYEKLLVAPVTMRSRFLEMIDREIDHAKANRGGRIIAKMNQLQDPTVIKALYRASQAGVQIDLIVRGFCCLRPGVAGLSENIRVRSVLGRFLEHSRIYHFANAGSPEFYIGSADWMNRNLDYRVEAITPVESEALQERLMWQLQTLLDDAAHHWTLQPTGDWQRAGTPEQRKETPHPQQLKQRRAKELGGP
jgi:polyphosphate kinase